jgi:hypothetical protein
MVIEEASERSSLMREVYLKEASERSSLMREVYLEEASERSLMREVSDARGL